MHRSPVLVCWFAGIPSYCVERWKFIDAQVRRFAGTQFRRFTNLLCWNVGSLFAGSPVRRIAGAHRFVGMPICCVERWKFIRRLAGTPVHADLPVCQYVVLKRWKLLLRRYADSPAYSIELERWKLIVRNNRLAAQSKEYFRSLHWLIEELHFELLIHSCSLLIIMKKGRSFPRLVRNNTHQLLVLSAGVFVSCSIKSIRPKQWSHDLTKDPPLAEANPVHNNIRILIV